MIFQMWLVERSPSFRTRDRELMSNTGGSDFGRYLVSVEERDVDLLLMEEFHIDDEFVAWFCARLGLGHVTATGAWHSVSDSDGETDLLLRVTASGKRIGVLIENKITAPEQDKQAERYHLRGIRSRETGKFDEYVTVMCAPQRYLDGVARDSAYQHQISYEMIADWFKASADRRSVWRHAIMREAIEQGRRGYTMVVSAANTKFHSEYWEHLRQKHPRLKMARPKGKGAYSSWVIMKGHDFPKGVELHHKIDQRAMELGFRGRKVEELLELRAEWPDQIVVVQKGKTASLVLSVPPIDMAAGFFGQEGAIEEALLAAYRLMPYSSLFLPRPKVPPIVADT